MKKLSKKKRKEMTEALLKSMGGWEHGSIMDYALISYEDALDKTQDEALVVEYHHNCFPNGVCDDPKCKFCKEED